MYSGYKDKNGDKLYLGDKVTLKKGELEREFTVCFGKVDRIVENHPTFEIGSYKVKISAFYFEWNWYKLFPVIHEDGIDDTKYMEKVKVV